LKTSNNNSLITSLAGILSYEKRICSCVWLDRENKTLYWSTNDKSKGWKYGSDSFFIKSLKDHLFSSEILRENEIYKRRIDFIKSVYHVFSKQIEINIPKIEKSVKCFDTKTEGKNSCYHKFLQSICKIRAYGEGTLKNQEYKSLWNSLSSLSSQIECFSVDPASFSGIEHDDDFFKSQNFKFNEISKYISIVRVGIEINRMVLISSLIGKLSKENGNNARDYITYSLLEKKGWSMKSVSGHKGNCKLHAEMKMLEQISISYCDGTFKPKKIFLILKDSINNGEFAVSKLCCLNCSLVFKAIALVNKLEQDYFDKRIGNHCEVTANWNSSRFSIEMIMKNKKLIVDTVRDNEFSLANLELEKLFKLFTENDVWNKKKKHLEIKENSLIANFQEQVFSY
jgi:hypothetical protein